MPLPKSLLLHNCLALGSTPSSHVLLQLWFTAVLRDGIATGASGGFASFKEIGTYHLERMLAQAEVSGDHSQAVQTVLSGFDDATCLDDVAPAFKQMHANGITVTGAALFVLTSHTRA